MILVRVGMFHSSLTYYRWAHIVAGIKRSVGEVLFDISALQVVITLPAIWPHYAQARMRQAATAAGILATNKLGAQTSIAFISEPEAAALATFQDMTNRPDIKASGPNQPFVDVATDRFFTAPCRPAIM